MFSAIVLAIGQIEHKTKPYLWFRSGRFKYEINFCANKNGLWKAEIINETGRVLDLTKQKLEVAYRTKSTFHF